MPTTSSRAPTEYNNVVLAYRNGAPVRVSDIGRAIDGPENRMLAGWQNGKRGILLIIFKQPGANVIDTVDRIKAALPQLEASIPPAIHVSTIMDRTLTIRASVADVQFTLLLAVCLVVMVIFLFLRNVWATIIPSTTVPVALICTFAAMYLLDYSLDNLSLMALTIAVGFVDRRRHRDAGEHLPPRGRGHEADGGGASRAPAKSASPSSRSASRWWRCSFRCC